MEFLKFNLFIFLIIPFVVTSCGTQDGDTVTEVIKLRSDTYISSYSTKNHSEYNYLKLSNSSSKEDRILLRLPSNDNDEDFFDDCFDDEANLCNVFFIPIAIVVKLLTTDCDALDASNLTSAILALDTKDGTDITAGSLDLNLLKKPWWYITDWKRAHPFSKDGKWKTPGGDISTSRSFDTNCTNLSNGSCAAGEVKFEMTDYFRYLLASKRKHYGLMISSNTDLSSTKLYSVQADSSKSPRIIAQYTCNTKGTLQTKVFYLGSKL